MQIYRMLTLREQYFLRAYLSNETVSMMFMNWL